MKLSKLQHFAALAALTAFSACGGGSGSSGGVLGNGFQLVGMSVSPDATWQINRPIDFTFSLPVDFSTVGLNTISIRDFSGAPASGAFSLLSPTVVRFQPTCPVESDLSDAGLKIGGVFYQVGVFGAVGGNGLTVEGLGGESIVTSQFLTFVTPLSSSPSIAFVDIQNGPPSPVVRQLGLNGSVINPNDDVSFIEMGGAAGGAVELKFDTISQTFIAPIEQGLNFFSDTKTQVAVLIEFNQPVNPSSANISEERLFIEFLNTAVVPNSWVPIDTTVSLERNCSATGATVRLVPQGILPQGSDLRVVITTEFEDLIGDRNQLQIDNFARFSTVSANFVGLSPAGETGDELKEDFFFEAGELGSLEDLDIATSLPRAIWGDGQLKAAFEFTGTGGSDGAFDWVIPAGQEIILDTNGAISIDGGDIGVNMENLGSFTATKQQNVVGGQVNVRHLVIENGASIRVQGTNPVTIQASGGVLIRGLLDLSGFDRPDVGSLDSGDQPEVGSEGAAGGGAGGTSSFLVVTSTPQGGNGFGAFGQPNFGGKGGESGFGVGAKDLRRPGGGAGGRIGPDATGPTDLATSVTFGMIAEAGFDGGPLATGAVTGLTPPRGGALGFTSFPDGDPSNDFLGFFSDGSVVIVGELDAVTAGYGGGAGGDAVPDVVFPHVDWKPGSDEKGAAGAGGGGGLRLLCLGDITIQGNGQIFANGGKGASGESTINNDHLGGGSGGGSGGHIVLEAGGQVVFDGVTQRCLSAQGGEGGQGKPLDTINQGGSGGPGVIQIHVLDPNTDIVFVNETSTTNTLRKVTFPDALQLVPSFGRRSIARSKWIAVGGAGVGSGGSPVPVTFFFDGTDPSTGLVLDVDDDNQVDLVAPILGPVALVASPALPSIGSDLRTLSVDATAIGDTFDDVYLRNPQLLRDAVLELREIGDASNAARFNIAQATFDLGTMTLNLEVDASPAVDLSGFNPAGGIEYLVYPNSFRLLTNGQVDLLPDSVSVGFFFEGAPAGPDGLPDLSAPTFVPLTGDISLLNASTPDFVRFQVLFDLDVLGTGLSAVSPKPSIDFTRIKLRF